MFAKDAHARRFAQSLKLFRRERKLFPLRLGQRASEFFFRAGDVLFLRGAGGFQKLTVSLVERLVQIVEVKAQVVARLIFREHAAFAVENFSAHRRQPDGAIRLRGQVFLIFA